MSFILYSLHLLLRLRKLQKQIKSLQAKIRKERQLNKQMEMNAELKKLKNLLNKMVR